MPELDIQGILEALHGEEVEFLVIGGIAVAFHGFVGGTKDVAIVPNPEPRNLAKLASVLAALDARVERAEEFEAGQLPDPLDPDALALGGNWVLNTRLGRFDVMQWIGDDALWGKLSGGTVEAKVGGSTVKFASYEDLVSLKEQAGRPQDLIDLQRLREARGEE